MENIELREFLRHGVVIPAHPLALTAERRLDERRQVALTRYYCEAGAGGVAVGVHTTQFAIRDPKVRLFESVLRLAIETVREYEERRQVRLARVAGICGATAQAIAEAELAAGLGYDAGLLSLGALREAAVPELIRHCREIATRIPLFGFYLQPAAGGRVLEYRFWREFLGDRERRGHQSRPVQPVPDPGCSARAGRKRTGARGFALYGER